MNREETAVRNAQASTGPRTAQGKAKSARNAIRHGLTARTDLLWGERPAQYADLEEALFRDLVPVGAMEEHLAGRIAGLAWRLKRVPQVEIFLFHRHRWDDDTDEDLGLGPSFSWEEGTFESLSRYETALERSLYRTLGEFQRCQAARIARQGVSALVVDVPVHEPSGPTPDNCCGGCRNTSAPEEA